MADLRIVDAPEIPTENITGEEKLPTGGNGNYSISLDSLADYTKTKKDLADNTSVDAKVNGVRQELDAHIEDLLNPHQVTKGQIGLGNVDNTADADKPVSNSVQAAIISGVSPKADKTYVDTALSSKVEKTYVDNQLTLKANKSDVYTKSETYSKSETYTKQESSDLVSSSISTELAPINTSLDLAKRGVANRYDSSLTYNIGERVVLPNGDIVKSTVDGNVNDPNVDMTGWLAPNKSVLSVSHLRLETPLSIGMVIHLESVNEGQDEGGGLFVATQKSSLVDNGGTIISSPKPNIFWVRLTDGFVTPQMFGSYGDGVNDDLSAFQRAVASGYAVIAPTPVSSYYLSDTLSIPPNVSFTGIGAESVKIISAVSGDNPAIIRSGVYGDTGMTFGSFGGFYLQSALFSRSGIGLVLSGLSYHKIHDVVVQAFNQGVYAQDCINIEWQKCYLINNIKALIAERGSYSHPNAWSFNDCVVNGNWNSGCTFINGCAISFTGGSIELNGIQGTADVGEKFGIKMLGNPYEGVLGLNVKGVYFEGNKGQADIVIDTSLNTNDAIHTITGSTFNRISATNFVNYNVLLNKQGTGRTVLSVSGSGFKRFNDYEANFARPYVDVINISNSEYHVDLSSANYYHDRNETPRLSGTQNSTKASVAAWVRFNGNNVSASNQNHNIASVEKISTGKYKVNYSKPLYISGNAYNITTNHVGFTLIDSEDVNFVVVQILDKDSVPVDTSLVSVTIFGEDS